MSANITVSIEFLTLAQRGRRADFAVARASFTSSTGTYGGHTIHDHGGYGRLTVEPARGSILNPDTKDQILAEYYRLGVQDRYAEERELYGIWDVATMPDTDRRAYMIHFSDAERDPMGVYRRYEAATIKEALALAVLNPISGAIGIMAADYAEARAAGVSFFEGDGLLV